MMNPNTSLVRPLAELDAAAHGYLERATAPATRRAYASDWRQFTNWCDDHALQALPAEPSTLIRYLTARASVRKASTLQRQLVAIAQAHRAAGLAPPTTDLGVRAVWRGIRRTHGTAQAGRAAIGVGELRAMVAALPATRRGTRDRALLLLGFAGAFRRGELVALDVEDLEPTAAGLVVTVRRGKTDPEGAGRKVGTPRGQHAATDPVGAVEAWLAASGLTTGPLFRGLDPADQLAARRLSDRTVALVVQRAAQRAGLDPRRYAGHSLRAGLATSAAAAGVEERDIMRQTGHRSAAVMRRYIRDGQLFRANAAAALGL